METLVGALALGTVTYAATNVDGLLVLMIFFADAEYIPAQIVAGQLAATALWIAISAAAAGAALVLPTQWLALLGVIPIALGLSKLKALRASSDDLMDEHTQAEADKSRSPRRTRSRAGTVALVALANGGDNVAVYVSLFATSTAQQIAGFAAVFLCLAVAWCLLAYVFVRGRWLGTRIEVAGERVLPLVLLGLGLYIVAKGFLG